MLIGERQEDLAAQMKDFFSLDGYIVDVEKTGFRIGDSLRENRYAILVLDAALPGIDAVSLVRSYREGGGSMPILLTVQGESSEELRYALDAGVDAYLSKPFHLLDLAAHVRALMRRPAVRKHSVLTSGAIAMDTRGGTVTRNDICVHLHPMEYKLLHFLLSHPNEVFSSHALFERVWQKDFGLLEGTVRTHIRTLRQKIDSVGSASIITTVRGLGYKSEKS